MKPRAALPGLALFGLGVLPACVSTVTPPSDPADPVNVYIIDYGRHVSLVMPDAQGFYREYTFGDWTFYANDRNTYVDGALALLAPTTGTLGRSEIGADPDPVALADAWGIESAWPLRVEQEAAARVAAQLGERYEAGLERTGQVVTREDLSTDFVKDPHRYWVFHHCSHEVNRWLREMGCGAEGVSLIANYRVLGVAPVTPGGGDGGERSAPLVEPGSGPP